MFKMFKKFKMLSPIPIIFSKEDHENQTCFNKIVFTYSNSFLQHGSPQKPNVVTPQTFQEIRSSVCLENEFR